MTENSIKATQMLRRSKNKIIKTIKNKVMKEGKCTPPVRQRRRAGPASAGHGVTVGMPICVNSALAAVRFKRARW